MSHPRSHFRQFLAEVPLAAVAASAAYQGICSAGFQKRRSAIRCGLLLGLGLLLKVTFIVYGAGILVGVIAQRLRAQKRTERWSKTSIGDLLWGVGPALGLAACWYVPHYKVALWWIVEGGYGRIIKLYGS
jgi:4-amino-4-deoxy-L-arabinose transferase-like glycosyltransferase